MFPSLIEFPGWIPIIGGAALHTYGLLVAAGFFAGMLWVKHESERVGIDAQKMMDLFFYVVLSAIIGSRVFYVIASIPEWWKDPLVFFRFWEGGLVFYGGLIAAVVVGVWYGKKHHLSFLTVADTFSPGVALGHVFGRFGCFFAGCCYGRETPPDFPLSVLFPQTKYSIAPYDHRVYPTQLFEAAGELAIFAFLFFFRKRKKFEGEVFLLYIILYPVLRSVIEIYRGDGTRNFVIPGVLSAAQLISILWVCIAAVIWVRVRGKKA